MVWWFSANDGQTLPYISFTNGYNVTVDIDTIDIAMVNIVKTAIHAISYHEDDMYCL